MFFFHRKGKFKVKEFVKVYRTIFLYYKVLEKNSARILSWLFINDKEIARNSARKLHDIYMKQKMRPHVHFLFGSAQRKKKRKARSLCNVNVVSNS